MVKNMENEMETGITWQKPPHKDVIGFGLSKW